MNTTTASWVNQGTAVASQRAGSAEVACSATPDAAGSSARAAGFSHEASDAFGAIGYEAADPTLQERLWQAATPDPLRLWQRS